MVWKVRLALRRVSASGQSQARSIWAWPVSASAPCLRVALAQLAQLDPEDVGRARHRLAVDVVEAARRRVEIGRQLPDALGFGARGHAGHVGGGRGRPVEPGQRRLGGGQSGGTTSWPASDLGGVGDLAQEQRELDQLQIEPDQPGAR